MKKREREEIYNSMLNYILDNPTSCKTNIMSKINLNCKTCKYYLKFLINKRYIFAFHLKSMRKNIRFYIITREGVYYLLKKEVKI